MFSVKKRRNVLPAICAGILNGLLGTGGGIPLWFAVNARKDRRTAFATASAGVLILSLVSVVLYRGNASLIPDTFTYSLWFAILGGTLGASLLKRAPLALLRLAFSFLLIGSGVYSVIKVVYDAFFA